MKVRKLLDYLNILVEASALQPDDNIEGLVVGQVREDGDNIAWLKSPDTPGAKARLIAMTADQVSAWRLMCIIMRETK